MTVRAPGTAPGAMATSTVSDPADTFRRLDAVIPAPKSTVDDELKCVNPLPVMTTPGTAVPIVPAPGATVASDAGGSDCAPTPDSETSRFGPPGFANVTAPERLPAASGVNVTETAQVLSGGIDAPHALTAAKSPAICVFGLAGTLW